LPKQYLLQVHGSNRFTTQAVEVTFQASSLNTNNCFILVKDFEVVVWFGKGSTGDEREMAKILGLERNPDPSILFEGQEKPFFWQTLGGKEDYFSEVAYKQDFKSIEPRLFVCSNATGYFSAEEVFEFTQKDLLEDDIMLLDAYHTIFIWIGINSNIFEQQESLRIAEEYILTCPTERDINTPLVIVKQGREPVNFKGFFGPWDEELWADLEVMYSKNNAPSGQKLPKGVLPYSVLSGPDCPDSIDPSRKEDFLSDIEFFDVFQIDRENFDLLPNWKKNDLKKKYYLF